MNNLDSRIDRLGEKLGTTRERRATVVTNVGPRVGESENPRAVRIAPDRWAYAIRGGPFTSEEIRKLREKHGASDGQS